MFARLKRIAPRRGWRAFTGEVGIIVLGVLIAVGIGKAVEALDWREKVASAKTVLDREISETDQFNLTERQRVTPCLRRQLDRLRTDVLTGGPDGVRVPRYSTVSDEPQVYKHPSRAWNGSSWDSVVADNIPAHMSVEDRTIYSSHSEYMKRMDALNAEELIAAADLLPLYDGIHLDPAAQIEMLRVIARERSRVDFMDLISRQVQARLRDSGRAHVMAASDYTYMNTERWCRANGLF